MALRVSIRDKSNTDVRYYMADLTLGQAKRHDNGALISCGLTVPDDLSRSTLKRWINDGTAFTVLFDEWNHSSCQSSCVKRGGTVCRW